MRRAFGNGCVQMDLKDFYFNNIQDNEYHHRFYDSIKTVNEIYNVFSGVEEVNNYQFEVFDAEEAIIKFRELCQPEVSFDKEKTCWFYLVTYYLYKLGYQIKEFPRIIARPPEDPSNFTYNDIRNRIIAQGGDENGTVRYATRRTFVSKLTFEMKSTHIDIGASLDQKFIEISNRHSYY